MNTLLIGLSLAGQNALIIGGGELALRKARLLLKTTAKLVVVAPTACTEIHGLAAQGTVTLFRREYRLDDLNGVSIVFAATGRDDIDIKVATAAKLRNIPVNVPDKPTLSSFNLPALIDRSPILVGVSTDGTAPLLARSIRAQIEALLPANLGRLALFADGFRKSVASVFSRIEARRRFWEEFFSSSIAAKVLAGDEAAAARETLALLNRPEPRHQGSVAIVGAGPGDPDLLTLKALRRLQEADVIVYDRLLGPSILDRARRDAELIFAGKQPANHGMGQDAINALLAKRAQCGQRVVRLKGGDPFIFGRGREEQEYLRRHGISVEIVPGITAASGCAAAAGIPLTHRGTASAVTFATGHGTNSLPNIDWRQFSDSEQTLVLYMGVSTAREISTRLIDGGLPASTPVAVIENGTRPDQRVLRSSLAEVAEVLHNETVTGPAILVIGAVARLSNEISIEVASRLAAIG
jgi:uroporphyrin-III C-methyltransferase / precorrin-2 dehydrogenase / sirohydrochlorin ferrochelatase